MSRLDRIFIRVQDENGQWDTSSVADATVDQFDRWAGMYLRSRLGQSSKEKVIEMFDEFGVPPVELKEDYDSTTEET